MYSVHQPNHVMKANVFLSLVFLSGLAALVLGAGLAAAFTVMVAAGLVGLACNDYAARGRGLGFGRSA